MLHPDGSEAELRIPVDLSPDGGGTYQILYDYSSTYTGSLEGVNRFTFILEAGASEIVGGLPESPLKTSSPIAISRLFVDVGRGAYIDSIAPVICRPGQVTEIQVTIGDYEYSNPETMRVRISDGTEERLLDEPTPSVFSADVTDLCQPLLARLACSTGSDAVWSVSLVAQTQEGYPVQSQRNVDVQIQAPACTSTPTPVPPTPTPTPTPLPTPVPDSDLDGGNDLIDRCVSTPGLERFDWCPTPWWVWALLAALVMAVGALFIFYLIPLLHVKRNPPPKAHLEVIKGGQAEAPKSIYSAGEAKRKSNVTIGSSKKAVIQVTGLKPFEYVVIRESDDRVRVYKTNDKGEETRTGGRTISEQGEEFNTSNDDIRLKVSLTPQQKGASRPSKPNRPGRRR